MKKLLLVAVILLWSSQASAQLSARWERLESLRQKITLTPREADEHAYLATFPSTFREFNDAFGGYLEDQIELANVTEQHLDFLGKLAKKYPEAVIDIEIGIAVGGRWDADAVSFFQNQLVKHAAADTNNFVKLLLQVSRAERASVIRFMADVENHSAFYEYGAIISNLRKLELNWLADEFELAREVRRLDQSH